MRRRDVDEDDVGGEEKRYSRRNVAKDAFERRILFALTIKYLRIQRSIELMAIGVNIQSKLVNHMALE